MVGGVRIMDKLLKFITEQLNNGNYILIVLAITLVIIYKFEKIFSNHSPTQKPKLNLLKKK